MAIRAYWLSGTTEPGVNAGWQIIKKADDQSADDENGKAPKADDLLNALRGQVQDVVECEHVMVLLGLGASLYLKRPTTDDESRRAPESLFPTMPGLWRAVEEGTPAAFESIKKIVPHAWPNAGEAGQIETLLTDCQMYASLYEKDTSKAADVRAVESFVQDAAKIIANKCDQDLRGHELGAHIALIRALNRRDSKKPRPEIYTTNYDMCVEHACGETDTLVLDGFGLGGQDHYSPATLDMDITERMPGEREMRPHPSVLRLYKLHGSVNWFETDGLIRRGAARKERGTPVMIYPRGEKYRDAFRQPFLEMMARFQSGLRRRSVGLVVIGFGFNDDHLSEPIWMALQHNPSLRLLIVDPCLTDWRAASPNPGEQATYRWRIAQIAQEASRDPRVTLVNAPFAGNLEGWSGDYSFVDVLPEVGGKTTREIAEQRLRAIEKVARGGDAS